MNHVCNTCTILKQQLAAAKAELAELKKQNAELFPYYQDHCEGALIPATEYQQWIKRAEQAEEQNKRMRELLVEIQSYSETYLDLDSRMKHIIDCAKAALEGKP